MMHALASRMTRLVVSSRRFMSPQASTSSLPSSAPPLTIASIITPELSRFGFSDAFNHPSGIVAPTVQRWALRCLSSSARMSPVRKRDKNEVDYGATSSLGVLLSQEQAENFAAFAHANRHQKVKPFIVKRRINQLRTYIGNERNIRHSPWRLNLVCQFAAGQTVPEALKQLMFCQKVKAPLVAKVIRRTANLANIRHGLQPSQLEVAECFATHGTHLKRLKIMGRGR